MEPEVMKALLDAFEESDWQEMTVTIGGDRLHVSRRPDAGVPGPLSPAPAASVGPPGAAPPAASDGNSPPVTSATDAGQPQASQPDEPSPAIAGGVEITAPSVGLFWRAPAPGAAPFVEVGGTVAVGDTVAIVEVMKLMNHVTATCPGTVSAILVQNGAPVEFGQTLVIVEPEA